MEPLEAVSNTLNVWKRVDENSLECLCCSGLRGLCRVSCIADADVKCVILVCLMAFVLLPSTPVFVQNFTQRSDRRTEWQQYF